MRYLYRCRVRKIIFKLCHVLELESLYVIYMYGDCNETTGFYYVSHRFLGISNEDMEYARYLEIALFSQRHFIN